MTDHAARAAELAKYRSAYADPNYHLKGGRLEDAVRDLNYIVADGDYLDVSCGRGEMLQVALQLGYANAKGTEALAELCDGVRIVQAEAHALPFADKAFDVVSMLDVIEHLIPGDDELACRELRRVARRAILITANNLPSLNKAGDDLHINRRDYEEWDRLFRAWFDGCKVTWIMRVRLHPSQAWIIEL